MEWKRTIGQTPCHITAAVPADEDEILRLYKAQLGLEFCPWNEHYPENDTIRFDLSRDALFVMKNEAGEILAAISLDEDEAVEALDCWSEELQPAGEVSRLAVRPDCQNQGLARQMIRFSMNELARRGKKSIHYLVNKNNTKAVRSYAHLGFTKVGECALYDQPFLCYEKALWRQALFAMQDIPYRDFNSGLLPTVDEETMIGIRLPQLRQFARKFERTEDAAQFLTELPHRYYEENLLHMLLITRIRDYEQCLAAVSEFLPYIDNWAVCDVPAPKCFDAHRQELLTPIRAWLSSGDTYTVRYGIGILMRLYLDDPADAGLMELVAGVQSEEYYVNMMIAWYFATALAKQWEHAVVYLEEQRFSPWVQNKTIQKACESRCITQEQKTYLRTLKVKK